MFPLFHNVSNDSKSRQAGSEQEMTEPAPGQAHGDGESLHPVQPTPKGIALLSPMKSLQVLWAPGPPPSHGEQMSPGRPAASHPGYPGPGCGQDKAEGSASLAVNEEMRGREKLLPAVLSCSLPRG